MEEKKEAIMYYQASVLKADDTVIAICKIFKVTDQFEGKKRFMDLVLSEMEEGDYMTGVNGNTLDVEDKDIILD